MVGVKLTRDRKLELVDGESSTVVARKADLRRIQAASSAFDPQLPDSRSELPKLLSLTMILSIYIIVVISMLLSTPYYAYVPSINRRNIIKNCIAAPTLLLPSSSLALPSTGVPRCEIGKCQVSKTIQGNVM
jgi:uncharacterized protein YqhQ